MDRDTPTPPPAAADDPECVACGRTILVNDATICGGCGCTYCPDHIDTRHEDCGYDDDADEDDGEEAADDR